MKQNAKTKNPDCYFCFQCSTMVLIENMRSHQQYHESQKKKEEEEKAQIARTEKLLKIPKINIIPPLMENVSMVSCEYCHESVPFREYEDHLKTHQESDKEEETAPVLEPKFTRGNLVISCEICGEILPYKKYKGHLSTFHDSKEKTGNSPLHDTLLIQCEACGDNIAFDQYIEHVSAKHSQPVSQIKRMQTIEINVELPTNESQLLRIPFTGKSAEEQNVCDICFLDFTAGDNLIYLPCMHRFHEDCLVGWLSKKALCPICQKAIFKQ